MYKSWLGIFEIIKSTTCRVQFRKLSEKENFKIIKKGKISDRMKTREYCRQHYILH